MTASNLPDNPRFLITRLSHIGDCILTIPLANAIRESFPNSWIVWAIEAPGDKLIRECPAVDQVFKVPKSWLKKPFQSWSLRKLLRQFQFDVVIDPQSLTKSAGIGWLSGARTRIGLAKPMGRELSPWLNNVRQSVESRHVVDRTLELLKPLGIENARAEFGIKVPSQAQERAVEICNTCSPEQQHVIINPGAGWQSRQWSNERFGIVAKHLAQSHNVVPLVTWFGDEEEQMANEIVEHSHGTATKAPSTNLWELAGLIESSRFYLGCDTGPTHLAAALACPCITLFGTTEPEVSGPYEPDPNQSRHIRIQAYYQAGNSRQRRKAENEAMMEITADQVSVAIDQMISQTAGRAAA